MRPYVLILPALALIGTSCGSETESNPPCPETWLRMADTNCSPPDRDIQWNVYASAPDSFPVLDQSFVCQIETTDREARLNAWQKEFGVIARNDECVVVRNLNDSESGNTGAMSVTPTGDFSVAKGAETVGYPGTYGDCISTESPPMDFFDPGNTYMLSAQGTVAGDFEYEVSLPAPTTFTQTGTPQGMKVSWEPFGADRVSIRIGHADPYREVICETDDDGDFTVDDWMLAELETGNAVFRIEGENKDVYQLEDGTRVFVRGATSYEQSFLISR